ncbi:MAG: methylated-DNA--[protein]-cysteine S-methyltransferase [Acidimicrobiia bacterium]|nr:methylated-DNA--[protein]-cysteine S-methyltransferase [Acidimicrobiia bacterium]
MTNPTDAEIAAMLSTTAEPPASIKRGALIRTDLADQYTTAAGPLGEMFIAFTSLGISSIVPTSVESEFLDVHSRTVGRPGYRADGLPKKLATLLDKSLSSGKLGRLPVDLRQLTGFQKEVLAVTAEIPPGQVRPYGWVAKEMGNNGAVRAVGSALGRNPVPIVIPCHRVVRSDGAVGNYAFGSPMKVALLEYEGIQPEMLEPGSVALSGSDTTHIFCFPTCRHARITTQQHRVEFASVKRATAAGYRPCKVCRPA